MTYTLEETAEIFCRYVGNEPPCNFNDLDENVIDDEFCAERCGNVSPLECWEHALERGWLD